MQSKFFNTPFATAGDKIDIPDAAQVDGSVSFATGFGPDYEKELGVDPDAKPVPRDATNGVLFDITDALGAIQKQGAPQFIEAADNGGVPFSYGRGARVMYGSPARPWISRVDNNTTIPAPGPDWALEVFEVATNAQAIAGTDPSVVINPPALAAVLAATVVTVPDATESVKGIQRNATQAEANAGTLDNATMTPLKTAGAIAQQVPAATTLVAGRVRLATVAEAAGSSATLAVTPAGLTAVVAGKADLAGAAFTGAVSSTGTVTSGERFASSTPNVVLAAGSSGAVILRPNGPGSETGEVRVNAAGALVSPSTITSAGSFLSSTVNVVLAPVSTGTVLFRPNGEGSAVGEARIGATGAMVVAGALTAGGGFQNGSSRTVKDHVSDIDPAQALQNVLALRGVLYRYHGTEKVRAGYYAEEVRESRPEAVTEAGEDSFSPLLLEDAQMLPDHTGAIQELYRMVRELQEKQK